MRPSLLVLLALAAAGCGERPAPAAPAPTTKTMSTTSVRHTALGIVVPATLAIRPGDFYAHEIDGHWDPADDVIARFEAGLEAHLRRPDYHRQYLGLVMSGADKLYVSFYCAAYDRWDTPGAQVDDGGDCFYEVLYDIATDAYERVTFHGDA